MNAGNKNTPSTHHPRRRNATTLMVGLENGHIRKNLTQKVVNPRDIAGERQKKKKKKKYSSADGWSMINSCKQKWEIQVQIIIIVITLKSALQDFYNFLTAPLSPTRTLRWPGHNPVQIMCNTCTLGWPGHNPVQIMCNTCTLRWPGHNPVQIMCDTLNAYHVQHAVCRLVWKDSSAIKFELKSHLY